MSKVFKLTLVLLKTAGMSFEVKFGKKDNPFAGPVFWGLVALSLLPVMFLLYKMFGQIFAVFSAGDSLEYGAGLVTNMGGLVVFVFSMFSIPSLFYFSKDIETLLPMPLSSTQIIAAKFIVALIFEFLGSLFFVVPMTAALLPHVSLPELIPNAVITFITMPVTPLVYATLITMFFVRVTRFGKNRDFYNILVGIIGVTAGLSVSLAVNQVNSVTEEQMMAFIQGNRGAIDVLFSIFPNNAYAGMAMVGRGTGYQFFNLGIIAVCMVVFFPLAKVLYFKGVIGMSESGSNAKKMTKDEVLRGVASRKAFSACLQKEMRQLLRNPVAFTNCVLTVYLMPVILTVSFAFSFARNGIDIGSLVEINYSNPAHVNWVFIISTAAGFFFSAMDTVTATSISREGPNFFIMKYLPAPYRAQLKAKVMSGIIIAFPALALTFAALETALKMPAHIFLGALILSLPSGIFLSYTGLLVDITRPRLDWVNESYAVKQNMNVLIVMFGGMLLAVPVIVLGLFLLNITPPLPPLVMFLALFITTAGIAAGSHFLVLKIGEERMMKIE